MAYEVISKEKLSFNQIKASIEEALLKYIGLLGTSKAGLQIIKQENNKGILKINHKFTNHIKAAFTLINKINNKKATVCSIGTSGILKKAEAKYLRYQKSKISGTSR